MTLHRFHLPPAGLPGPRFQVRRAPILSCPHDVQRLYMRSFACRTSADAMDHELEGSTAAVDEIVRQVTRELLVESAATYLTEESTRPNDVSTIIRSAVESRLDSLNTTFLPVLDSYIEALESRDERDILGVLLGIRIETLKLLSERMPPEIQVLQLALEANGPNARMKVLRENTSGGASPSCAPDALALTISKIIEDMEGEPIGESEARVSTPELLDRRILAKLCLLREEARMIAAEARMQVSNDHAHLTRNAAWENVKTESSSAFTADISSYTVLRTVPQREVAFLKEVLVVGSTERRQGLLEAAFRGDIEVKPTLLRTGAFMDSLKALQTEILGPQYNVTRGGDGGGMSLEMAARLETVWREALIVLEKIANGTQYSS